MPIVKVEMMEGRSDEQKELLIQELTKAVIKSINSPSEKVTVLIHEIPRQNFGIAGKSAKLQGR